MKPQLFSALLVFLSACANGGYQIVEGTKAPSPSVGAGVILYGVEQGEPPPGCHTLGVVRAWSNGEKVFPYDNFRAGAAELGGDSVIGIHPDPAATDPKRPTHLGTVARCR
ncbi:MAG: hypothetical protein ACXWUG_20440 [Polyangiales bacterium]